MRQKRIQPISVSSREAGKRDCLVRVLLTSAKHFLSPSVREPKVCFEPSKVEAVGSRLA